MENPIPCSASSSMSGSRSKAKRCMELYVPDCLLMDILSRLHLKIVVQCRCVCKRWRDLISTPEFVVLQKQRHGMGGNTVLQMILVSEPKAKRRVDHFFMDKWIIDDPKIKRSVYDYSLIDDYCGLPLRKKSIIRRIHSYPLYRTEFSLEGFLVMISDCFHSILIVNPIERECHGVKIFTDRSVGVGPTNVYGIYFNPRVKEHCVLLGLRIPAYLRNDRLPYIDYQLLTLGAKPRWTYLRNPWNYQAKVELSSLERTRPVFVGGCLYWLVVPNNEEPMGQFAGNEDLMEFDTRTEEFTLIQNLPGRSSSISVIGLLNVDGFVSLVQITSNINIVIIDIWTLKDRVAQSWTSSDYRVSLVGVVPNIRWGRSFKPIGVECGQLIFQYETTLYACKLEGEGQTRICGRKKHNNETRFFSHRISLASLKNCQPVICMEGVDEKTYYTNCKDCGKCVSSYGDDNII